MKNGFTLIELSIVLVIIGLIVGGVLVGQDLIRAAAVRATITQVEKYNTSANTFYGKYGYLPGDINNTAALQFGFQPRATDTGGSLQGNGDGIIYGWSGIGWNCCGETLMFWVDLTTAGLIDGNFNTAAAGAVYNPQQTGMALYVPDAKIGQGNSILVWSDYCTTCSYTGNYYDISNIIQMDVGGGDISAGPGLTVQQAYTIDRKVDDGLPTSGRVMAYYNHLGGFWAGTANSTTAVSGSATTCYDNGGSISNPVVYSLTQNNGAGVNCALSLRFQ